MNYSAYALQNLLRTAIHFEGRTAFPASENDQRHLALLQSALSLLHAKHSNHTEVAPPSQETTELLTKAQELLSLTTPSEEESHFTQVKQLILKAKKLAYGGQADSKLDEYGCDMVFAATLGSVNAIMKEYLEKASSAIPVQTIYYVEVVEQGQVVYKEASPEVTKELESMDLFSIPQDAADRTPQQQANLDRAYGELMLSFAFRAAIGIPEGADVDNLIDFNTGETGNHTKVLYNLHFKELSILQFTANRTAGYIFSNITQSSAKQPWVFRFTVELGLVGVNLQDLPEDIRKKVSNIDPGQIFSVSQLFMDLNTASLMSSPSISGASPEATHCLKAYFLPYTFEKIKESTGDVIFGYSIVPDSTPSDKPYLLAPKDFRFYISPYQEGGQPVPDKKKLYTLNYLVICEDKPFPELRNIPWNWVEEKEYSQKNGVMAISKRQALQFAQQEYVKLLQNLLFTVTASMQIDDPINMKWSMGIKKDHTTQPKFENGAYSYCSSAEDSDTFFPIWGNIHFKYNLTAALRNYQTTDGKAVLECRVDTVSWLHFNAEGGVSEGTIFDKTTWYVLTVQIDEYGKLTLKPEYKEQQNKTTFNVNWWSSLIAIGLKDNIKDTNNNIESFLSDVKKMWDQAFLDRYNSNALWYLPGDSSLIFQQPTFSNNGDLTFEANYATPTAP